MKEYWDFSVLKMSILVPEENSTETPRQTVWGGIAQPLHY
jgi:hypothetical protein